MKISIPTPCREDWNTMTPVAEKQRHCAACDRTLTDFTGMTDLEIGNHLRRNPGKICGRFSAQQLDRKLVLGASRSFMGIRAVAAAAGLFLSIPSVGQETSPPQIEITSADEAKAALTNTGLSKQVKEPVSKRRTIRISGQVTDREGEGLIGASILVYGYCTGTVTDINGNFYFTVGAVREIKIIVSYTGFATLEHVIPTEDTSLALQDGEIDLALNQTIIMESTPMGYILAERSLPHRVFVVPVRRYLIRPVRKVIRNIGEWRAGRFERRAARQDRRAQRRVEKQQVLAVRETLARVATGAISLAEQPLPGTLPPATLSFKASPNPFTDHLRVTFMMPVSGEYRLALYSSAGQLVGHWEGKGEAGVQALTLAHEVSALPTGTYFLELMTADAASVLTLVR